MQILLVILLEYEIMVMLGLMENAAKLLVPILNAYMATSEYSTFDTNNIFLYIMRAEKAKWVIILANLTLFTFVTICHHNNKNEVTRSLQMAVSVQKKITCQSHKADSHKHTEGRSVSLH